MELKKRQQTELDTFREKVENGSISKMKLHFSSKVIEMEKRVEYLCQTGFYKEAKALKKQIKVLKLGEKEKFNVQCRSKLLKMSDLLISRHKKELKNLEKKHNSQRESLLAQRKKEFDIIEMRFWNVWNEMTGKFRKEFIELEKNSAVRKMLIKAKNRMPKESF